MNLYEVTANAIEPALALLPARMDSPEARIMLLAVGAQESNFHSRFQILSQQRRGKARGFWQFEEGGGVRGVMLHVATRAMVHKLCEDRNIEYEQRAIWMALAQDDIFAAGIARLYLWTDPEPLPRADNYLGAWRTYIKLWRPGKPHLAHWPANHLAALHFVLPEINP